MLGVHITKNFIYGIFLWGLFHEYLDATERKTPIRHGYIVRDYPEERKSSCNGGQVGEGGPTISTKATPSPSLVRGGGGRGSRAGREGRGRLRAGTDSRQLPAPPPASSSLLAGEEGGEVSSEAVRPG